MIFRTAGTAGPEILVCTSIWMCVHIYIYVGGEGIVCSRCPLRFLVLLRPLSMLVEFEGCRCCDVDEI